MSKSLWVIRIFFLILCSLAGYAVSQVDPELIGSPARGWIIGFGFGGLLIAIDEMLKGFSLRAFSAATFGLLLGTLIAWIIDHSGLFVFVDAPILWSIRLSLFVGFGYIGMVLAMRSNKEDISLIIPYVRFSPQNRSDEILLLDTSVIIDGRVADLLENQYLNGVVVVPNFVLRELQHIADSSDPARRARGRRGLDMLDRIERNKRIELKFHESDIPDEATVDSKLVRLAGALEARLVTNDFNLGKIAALQHVDCLNINDLAKALKPVILPGEIFELQIVREGKDRNQGVGFLDDGTMVVVNEAQRLIGRKVEVRVLNILQTGAGIMVFADTKSPGETA